MNSVKEFSFNQWSLNEIYVQLLSLICFYINLVFLRIINLILLISILTFTKPQPLLETEIESDFHYRIRYKKSLYYKNIPFIYIILL